MGEIWEQSLRMWRVDATLAWQRGQRLSLRICLSWRKPSPMGFFKLNSDGSAAPGKLGIFTLWQRSYGAPETD